MKRLLPLLLVLALPSALLAQSANPTIWCSTGVTWTYNYGEMLFSGTLAVRYVRDTVAGQTAQLLVRRISPCYALGPGVCFPGPSYSLPSVVTRVVNDRVEVQANGQFYTLYDFAATPGSSWLTAPVTPVGPCPSGLVLATVDSVGRQVVDGRSLHWFRAHLTAAAGTTGAGSWPGRIYEQLSNVAQYMQPQSPVCGGTDPGYVGPLIGFRATGCAEAAGFAVYPNPTAGAGWLHLRLPVHAGPVAQVRLLDIAGRLVRQQQVASGQALHIRGLPAGSYAVVLSEPSQPLVA